MMHRHFSLAFAAQAPSRPFGQEALSSGLGASSLTFRACTAGGGNSPAEIRAVLGKAKCMTFRKDSCAKGRHFGRRTLGIPTTGSAVCAVEDQGHGWISNSRAQVDH